MTTSNFDFHDLCLDFPDSSKNPQYPNKKADFLFRRFQFGFP
jgi:hypothetical protein